MAQGSSWAARMGKGAFVNSHLQGQKEHFVGGEGEQKAVFGLPPQRRGWERRPGGCFIGIGPLTVLAFN